MWGDLVCESALPVAPEHLLKRSKHVTKSKEGLVQFEVQIKKD